MAKGTKAPKAPEGETPESNEGETTEVESNEAEATEGKANYHSKDLLLIESTDPKFGKVGDIHPVGGDVANAIINKGWAKFKKYVKQYEA